MVLSMETCNRLKEFRQRAGMAAAELARLVGVSRQTVYAIEAGSYVPNTTLALLLSRQFGVSVEELFSLADDAGLADPQAATSLRAGLAEGQLVRLCRVGRRIVAAPAVSESDFFPQADGMVASVRDGSVLVRSFAEEGVKQRILVAGCDPGLSLLARSLGASGLEAVLTSAASGESLRLLKDGLVHVAGTHLRDPASGEYNVPAVRRHLGGNSVVVTFACWQEGLVVAAGNPKGITGMSDLTRRGVSIINRQEGSGSRQLLDRSLESLGIDPLQVKGFGRTKPGHLPAAAAVAAGEADCCVATEAAARLFGLHFIPLATERFDLVTLRTYLDQPAVTALFDALNRLAVRRQLQSIAGYDVSLTGSRRS
jgi:putative molybdopterin biosynthesis protein